MVDPPNDTHHHSHGSINNGTDKYKNHEIHGAERSKNDNGQIYRNLESNHINSHDKHINNDDQDRTYHTESNQYRWDSHSHPNRNFPDRTREVNTTNNYNNTQYNNDIDYRNPAESIPSKAPSLSSSTHIQNSDLLPLRTQPTRSHPDTQFDERRSPSPVYDHRGDASARLPPPRYDNNRNSNDELSSTEDLLYRNRSSSLKPSRPDYLELDSPKSFDYAKSDSGYPEKHLDINNIQREPSPHSIHKEHLSFSSLTKNPKSENLPDHVSPGSRTSSIIKNDNSENVENSQEISTIRTLHHQNEDSPKTVIPSTNHVTVKFPEELNRTNERIGDLPRTIYDEPSQQPTRNEKGKAPSASEMIRRLNNKNSSPVTSDGAGAISNKILTGEKDRPSSAGSTKIDGSVKLQQQQLAPVSKRFEAKTIERAPSKAKDIAERFNKSLNLQQQLHSTTATPTTTTKASKGQFDNTLQRLNKEGKISARCPKCKWRKVDQEGDYCQECRSQYLSDLKQRVTSGTNAVSSEDTVNESVPPVVTVPEPKVPNTPENFEESHTKQFKCVQCGRRDVVEEDGYCDNCESDYL